MAALGPSFALRSLRPGAWCFFLPMTGLEEEALHQLGKINVLICQCANEVFPFYLFCLFSVLCVLCLLCIHRVPIDRPYF